VEEHVFVVTLEASGEVTPALPVDEAAEPEDEAEEVEQ
jgi:hypothetical protein